MRHRWANAQRNRIRKDLEDVLSWRQKTPTPTAIHAHCLNLYCSAPGGVAHKQARHTPMLFLTTFYNHLLFALRLVYPPSTSPDNKREAAPGTRRHGIRKRQYGAAPFRRAHEISLNANPTITGWCKPLDQACPGIKTADAPLLFTRTACCFIFKLIINEVHQAAPHSAALLSTTHSP